MIRTIKIRIKDNKVKDYIISKIYSYRHFENIYLIILQQDHNQGTGDFNILIDEKVMRAVFRNNGGGRVKDKVLYIKDKYKNNQLMQDLIKASSNLKIHNLVMIMRRVKAQYKGYFTKIEKGDVRARIPKPRKLSKLIHYTIPLDSSKSYSLKRKNTLGLNLDEKMIYTHINYNEILNIVTDFKNINSVDINYSNGEVYLLICYEKEEMYTQTAQKLYKSSGLDIGINNLAALYIDDETTPSIIIDGKKYKSYNANFNRFIAKLNNDIATSKDEDRIKYLMKYRKFLYEKRNRFFFNEFHKISKRILEYLNRHEVTELVISKNLSKLKNNGNCELSKSTKQSFIQIPFIKLLDNIVYKASDYGVNIVEIDESYTSKTSSISEDIRLVQELSKDSNLITNDFKGSRVKRGLFLDKETNKVMNADLNGARNICFLSPNIKNMKRKDGESVWLKLCNPIKVESDFELCTLIA